MAHFKITDTKRWPHVSESYLVTSVGKKTTSYGEKLGNIHGVLVGLAETLKDGDIVESPEGFSYFKTDKSAMPRN
jgi:hypothetical protein